jgi:plasmid stabilization system protein ParE
VCVLSGRGREPFEPVITHTRHDDPEEEAAAWKAAATAAAAAAAANPHAVPGHPCSTRRYRCSRRGRWRDRGGPGARCVRGRQCLLCRRGFDLKRPAIHPIWLAVVSPICNKPPPPSPTSFHTTIRRRCAGRCLAPAAHPVLHRHAGPARRQGPEAQAAAGGRRGRGRGREGKGRRRRQWHQGRAWVFLLLLVLLLLVSSCSSWWWWWWRW